MSNNPTVKTAGVMLCNQMSRHLPSIQGVRMRDKAIFDKDTFLHRVLDDMEIAIDVINEFTVDIPKQISILKNAIESNDTQLAELQAHSVKGAAANISANKLHLVAYEMEKATASADWSQTSKMIFEMEREYNYLLIALDEDGFKVPKKAA